MNINNNINFSINFHVSTTREEIKRQLKLTGYHFVKDEIKLLADKIAEAFVDGDYRHSFLDEGGRFDPLRDNRAYLVFVVDCVVELYKEERSF